MVAGPQTFAEAIDVIEATYEFLLAYAAQGRGREDEDAGSGIRERLMQAARRRELDTIVVWRLDRWGRSLADLVRTLQELHELGVG